jgi:hypothetical protein
MQVNLQPIAPADITNTSVILRWTSNPAANNDANGYVGISAGNYGFSTPADQSGQLPGVASFTATISGLNPGTSYVAMAEADGANSSTQSFATTGGVAPTAHLVALACRLGDDGGDDDGGDNGDGCDVGSGEKLRIRVRTEKFGVSGSRLPGVTVNFAITGGSGSGQLKQNSSVSNKNGVAKVGFIGGNAGNVQITASSPTADGPVTITVTVDS